jgi:SulP family sulfate permease
MAAPLAGYLAMPALAALLIMTAWGMSEPQKWKSYAAAPNEERLLLLLTLVLTVLADLTVAIGVGVAVGLALRLRKSGLGAQDWRPPEP